MVILRLLELLNADADASAIETAVKRDALTSLTLLRLVNSRAAGSGRRIESVSEAVTKLGRKQLRRWLQILLYATGAPVELNSPLLQLATTRGKLLELMSLQVHPENVVCAERAFTVGIMSLADALFSMPMADILENVELADDVRAALKLVATGEAPLGIVYGSDAVAEKGVGVVATFPADSHAPITYPAAVTKAADTPQAKLFLDSLKQDPARSIFQAQGFTVPE